MMFLSLALIFAGMNKVFAQPYTPPHTTDPAYLGGAAECVPAVPLNCVTDAGALNPLPGETYTYAIKGEGATAITGVQWFVYNATATTAGGYGPNIIVDGVLAALSNAEPVGGQFLLSAEDHYGFMTPTPTTETPVPTGGEVPFTIDLSWNSFDGLANEILLVAYVEGDCADNIEIYRIQPAFSFTLDIASLMPNGSLNATRDGDGNPLVISNAEECVSPVWSATYDPIDPDSLTMDYGANYVFFTVTAANFVHSWQPTFSATHSGTPSSSITEIAWATPADAASETGTWHYADETTGAYDPVTIQASGANAVGADGECIIVRVLVEHGNVENNVASSVFLTVNGIMYDAAEEENTDKYSNTLLADLDEPTSGGTACEHVEDADTAEYVLTPRPAITTDTEPGDATPAPFVPKN